MLYADTNVLVASYLDLDGSGRAEKFLFENFAESSVPLPVTDLLRCEFTNALERVVFESIRGGQWRVTREIAGAAQAAFEEHLGGKQFLLSNSLSIGDIQGLFLDLSQRHTSKYGFRTYDIMHVSFALALQCDEFFSFDKKAQKLAALEGLSLVTL